MTAAEPYLKTQRVAETLGVSASTVKRWADTGLIRAVRTLGKHRLIPVSEAVRMARAQGVPAAQLEILAGLASSSARGIDDQIRGLLFKLLRESKDSQAKALILSVYSNGGGAAVLGDQLIRPVMERIGHGWFTGALDIYHEHQAARTVASALLELIDRQKVGTEDSRPLAVGASPEGDPYVLPPLLGELLLREMGWDVRNLGVNLPLASLASAARVYCPKLIFLCVSYLRDRDAFIREYRSFYEAVGAGSALVVGGQALGPDLRARLLYAGYGDRMVHLQEFARRVATAAGPLGDAEKKRQGDRPST